jgi:aspartate/methionine/tyrosine aminotransferase
VTSSLTKVYGFDGPRCGWTLASLKLAETIWRLQDFYGVNGAIPAEKISTAIFENIERFEQRTRVGIDANRKLVDRFMTAHAGELKWVPPDAVPVCFPQLRGPEDGWQLGERLYRDCSTRIIPGKFFEMPKHFRPGFGGDRAVLKAGLALLSRVNTPSRNLSASSVELPFHISRILVRRTSCEMSAMAPVSSATHRPLRSPRSLS